MGASLLLDIGPLSHDCTDHALEAIYKSAAEQPPEATIWAPHHDPYVRDHVEAVTARGQSILVNILNDVLGRLGGEPVAICARACWPRRRNGCVGMTPNCGASRHGWNGASRPTTPWTIGCCWWTGSSRNTCRPT